MVGAENADARGQGDYTAIENFRARAWGAVCGVAGRGVVGFDGTCGDAAEVGRSARACGETGV